MYDVIHVIKHSITTNTQNGKEVIACITNLMYGGLLDLV